MPKPSHTLGEIAYNAYCDSRGWKSVRNEPLPAFFNQSPELQKAWEAAGKAVANEFARDVDEVAVAQPDSGA